MLAKNHNWNLCPTAASCWVCVLYVCRIVLLIHAPGVSAELSNEDDDDMFRMVVDIILADEDCDDDKKEELLKNYY